MERSASNPNLSFRGAAEESAFRHSPETLRKITVLLTLCLFASVAASAQDLTPGAIYICSGERLFIESCNMRDTSDTSSCMVGHPDHIQPNGLMQYTNATRGALKKLFPTCTPPPAKQLEAAKAFQKKQQDTYDANAKKANDQLNAPPPSATSYGAPQKPRTPEERQINRCITSGRLPSSCTGNALLSGFSQLLGSVLPSVTAHDADAGPVMAGVFEGPGHWRLDFIDGGVLVNCSNLSPNQESYHLSFASGHPEVVISTRPKPLVLALHAGDSITGPGPIILDGVIAGGYTAGSSTPGSTSTSSYNTTERVNSNQVQAGSNATYAGGGTYDVTTTHSSTSYTPGSSTPGYTNFAPHRVTCPALNLSSKGAGVGIQTMQTDLLKTAFGGDKGPPTPPGIRMKGIYASPSTGFSVQFFPESVILGCGPDAARAYPYKVDAEGTHAVIHVDAPDHPLTLTLRTDNTIDPGTGTYQVHGRTVTGENDNGDFTFAPMERTCNLAALTPSKEIPSTGGANGPATAIASTGATGTPNNNAGMLSTPQAPLGNATLSIVSGFPAQPGAPSPLAGRPYILLRESYGAALAKGGVAVPPGANPYKYAADACARQTPDCPKVSAAVKASAISAVRADAAGAGTMPGVPPGSYYLMISARVNNQTLVWGQAVQIKAGTNSLTLDQRNATPLQ